MLRVLPTFDPAWPGLAPYRVLRSQSDHLREGVFIAEGEKTVRRLLATRLEIVSALLTQEWLEVFADDLERRPESIHAQPATHDQIQELTGFKLFEGLLVLARIPRPVSLDTLLAKAGLVPLFVALDGLTNPDNLGVLIRSALAFGADAVLPGADCASLFLRRSVRASMGAVFELPIAEAAPLETALPELSRRGLRVVAAHPHATGKTLPECDLRGGCCLVFGHETQGVRHEVLAVCDEAVAIPMPLAVDSLNVASAAAVFLYEAARQRGFRRAIG